MIKSIKQFLCRHHKATWCIKTRVYLIEVVDTETSETVKFIVDDYNHSRKLFCGVNDFILQIRKKENW